MGYLRFTVESQTCVIAGHHGTIEPRIVRGGNETFAQTLRCSANVDRLILWVQVEVTLGRVGFGSQGREDDVCYEPSASRVPQKSSTATVEVVAYAKTKASLESKNRRGAL
jgi:hypothetical protein